MIVYDCEIVRGILGPDETPREGVEYCAGWEDYGNMGISVICAYDYGTQRPYVFLEDNFDKFQQMVDAADIVVGFNSLKFDNRLCDANDLVVPDAKSYDLLVEIWKAAGLGPKFERQTHMGFSLNACALANLGVPKSGNGALAPVAWQLGHRGAVIDYCLNDVMLTKRILDLVIADGCIKDPRVPAKQLFVDKPDIPTWLN